MMPMAVNSVHERQSKGRPSGRHRYLRLDQMLSFSRPGFSGRRWRLLRCAIVQAACCEISVGWHAGIPAARQEYPEPAAC